MYTITKQFAFSGSHVLNHLADGHPCSRLHGHNYIVEVVIRCPCLDVRGFCQVDYLQLEPFKKWIDETLHHRHLNAVMGDIYPTAELLAKFCFAKVKEITPYVYAVRISETPKTWAEYCP